jgi:hypothetical protein
MKKVKHSFRKLTLEEKTGLLREEYGVSYSTIRRIRNTCNVEEKLLEAAKIQLQIFGNIHNDLTAWIAGYSSESVVRKTFGSTIKLRSFLFPDREYNDDFSQEDIRRNIKIPDELTGDLAEETGIHIGDGNLNVKKENDGWFKYRYRITGDLTNELIYHENFIKPLLKRLYNHEGSLTEQKEKNAIITSISSKAIALFKHNTLGLPTGSKKDITIPRKFEGNLELAKNCLRGIIDTDFTLNQDMQLVGNLASLKLLKQMTRLLDALNVRNRLFEHSSYGRIVIYRESAAKILDVWHLNNQKHASKYKMFNEFKCYIPFTTTLERLALLKGVIDVEKLVNLSNHRKNVRFLNQPKF